MQRLTWDKIRNDVSKIHPILAQHIDKLAPDNTVFFYRVSYPYGHYIVKSGIFQIPLDNEDVDINHEKVPLEFSRDFEYAGLGLPTGIVLNNTYELLINTNNWVLPVLVAHPGSIFGLWRDLDELYCFHPFKIYEATAGVRSLFMLANIGDNACHQRLRDDFNVSRLPPKTLSSHWSIFKGITAHEAAPTWNTELLFFPGALIKKIKTTKICQPLYLEFF